MQSKATTVAEYLAALPPDRREAISAIRKVIKKNLPKGYAEGMQYGMIGYFVPHSIFPDGYHCDPKQPLPFASVASQKNHMAIYLMCIYSMQAHRDRFMKDWKASGKKLDMGKSCVRFKRIEDVALDVVGEAIARVPVKDYVAFYEASRPASAKRSSRPAAKKTAPKKKQAGKKTVTKKATSKKPAAKKAGKKVVKKVVKKAAKKPAARARARAK